MAREQSTTPKRTSSDKAIDTAISALKRLNPDSLDEFATRAFQKAPRTAVCVLDALEAAKTNRNDLPA